MKAARKRAVQIDRIGIGGISVSEHEARVAPSPTQTSAEIEAASIVAVARGAPVPHAISSTYLGCCGQRSQCDCASDGQRCQMSADGHLLPPDCARGVRPEAHTVVTVDQSWEVTMQHECQKAVDRWRMRHSAVVVGSTEPRTLTVRSRCVQSPQCRQNDSAESSTEFL